MPRKTGRRQKRGGTNLQEEGEFAQLKRKRTKEESAAEDVVVNDKKQVLETTEFVHVKPRVLRSNTSWRKAVKPKHKNTHKKSSTRKRRSRSESPKSERE
jgi:hypothetical protein